MPRKDPDAKADSKNPKRMIFAKYGIMIPVFVFFFFTLMLCVFWASDVLGETSYSKALAGRIYLNQVKIRGSYM